MKRVDASKRKTIREKDGKTLEFSMMYDSAESIQKTMAETLQAEWAAIGVGVKLEGVGGDAGSAI